MAQEKKERIFISYKRVDKERVFAIKDGIEQATGEKCWIDLDGIESDAQFADVIISAINRCEVFLFMYSASHTKIVNRKKDWTIREISFAEKKDKRIVFVNIDNSPLTDWFELNFGTTQQVDATDTEKLAHLHNDLCSWLKIDIRKIQQDSYKDASKAEQDRLRKEKELQERMAQAEAEKKAQEEKTRLEEKKVHLPEHLEAERASQLYNLALLYSNTQRFADAEAYYLRALEIYERLATAHPEAYESAVAHTLNNLADLYKELRQYTKSEAYYLRALEIYERLASAHPEAYESDVAWTLNNLAGLYEYTQHFNESETYYLRALEIYKRLASVHPEAYESYVSKMLHKIANLFTFTQRFDEAEEYLLRALDISERSADTYSDT